MPDPGSGRLQRTGDPANPSPARSSTPCGLALPLVHESAWSCLQSVGPHAFYRMPSTSVEAQARATSVRYFSLTLSTQPASMTKSSCR